MRVPRFRSVLATIASAATVGAILVQPAAAMEPQPQAQQRAKVIHELHHDVSAPLSSITPKPTGGTQEEKDVPVKLPHPPQQVADPVVQTTPGTLAPTVGAD